MNTVETIQETTATPMVSAPAVTGGAVTAVALADTPVELSATERLFLAHYRRVWTMSKAAQRAGLNEDAGRELAARPHVKAEMERMVKAACMSVGEIEGSIANLTAPVGDDVYEIDESGFPRLNFALLKQRGGLDSIEQLTYDNEGRPIPKFYSRLKALELLAKVKGMFNDGMNISLNTDINIGGVVATVQAALKAPKTLDEMMNLAEKLAAESGAVLDVKALPQASTNVP